MSTKPKKSKTDSTETPNQDQNQQKNESMFDKLPSNFFICANNFFDNALIFYNIRIFDPNVLPPEAVEANFQPVLYPTLIMDSSLLNQTRRTPHQILAIGSSSALYGR